MAVTYPTLYATEAEAREDPKKKVSESGLCRRVALRRRLLSQDLCQRQGPPHTHRPACSFDLHQVFNCAQRAHANTLEFLPTVLTFFAYLGCFHPKVATGSLVLWVLSRVSYTVSGPPNELWVAERRGHGV